MSPIIHHLGHFHNASNMASPAAEASQAQPTPENAIFSLENILSNHDDLEHPKYREEDKPTGGWDEDSTEKPAAEGYCIECEGLSRFPCHLN